MLYGAAISLSVGLVGVIVSFLLGAVLGGVSGFYGGVVDTVLQRLIEFLISMPTIPLWMALSAAMPAGWTAVQVYFAITLILSLQSWCGLARVVRSKLLEVREEDFVMAAQLSGSSDWRIITRHLLPSFMSYLIVNMTLAIPNMILGETSLSFLGLGLRPPVVSWGVLLQQAQNIRPVATYPWIMWPGAFVIVTVLAFNFMGDGPCATPRPVQGLIGRFLNFLEGVTLMEGVWVGCCQITWGPGASEDKILSDIARAGFAGAPANGAGQRSGQETVDLYARYGLKPAPGYLPLPFWRTDLYNDMLERARVMAKFHRECGLTECYVLLPRRTAL